MIRALLLAATVVLTALPAWAQTSSFSPTPIQHFVDSNGIALTGGKVFTYAAGTTTKQATYTDSANTVQQTNPIILNSRGEPQNNSGASVPIFLGPLPYKFVLAPSTDTDPPTSPIWTVDNISPNGFVQGNQTAVATVAARIDYQFISTPDYVPYTYLGQIFPTKIYDFALWAKEITSADPFSQTLGGAYTGLFQSFNKNSLSTGVALGAFSTVFSSNSTLEAFNGVCLTGGGSLTGIDMNCMEIDFEPAVGDVVSSGGGINVAVFSGHQAVSGFYTSVGGGSGAFLNDFNASTAYGSNYLISGNAAVYGFDAHSAVFSGAAVAVGTDNGTNGQQIRVGVGGAHIAAIYGDGANLIVNSQGPIGFNTVAPISNFTFKHATNVNTVLRGFQNLATGFAVSSLDDAGSTFKGLEIQGSQVDVTAGPLIVGMLTGMAFAGGIGELGIAKITDPNTAPGAAMFKMTVVAGTNSGTCKIVARAGTSATPVTVIDNVGTGC